MKQLKVIVDSYNTRTGLIQASFGEPIIMKKGAKLALENFSLDVLSGTAGVIPIDDSTILINTNNIVGNAYNVGFRTVTIPSQVLRTEQELMDVLTNSFNSILISDYLYVASRPSYVSDLGLCFINYLSGTNKEFANLSYSGVDLERINPILNNAIASSIDLDDGYVGENNTNWYIAYPQPLLLGGLSVIFNLKLFFNGLNAFEWGITNTLSLTTPNLLQYGFRVKTNNELYIVSNGVESLLNISLTPFLNPAFDHQFYVENGKLRYQIYNPNNLTFQYKTDLGVFSNFNFIDQIFFGMRGISTATTNVDQIGIYNCLITFQPALSQNNLGFYLNSSLLDTNVYLGGTIGDGISGAINRTVSFDFSGASSLRAGLGLESNTKTINRGVSGNYAGTFSIKFGSYFDLCLEITNLPLQSWIANTNNSTLSKRTNILSYFTPQRLSTGSSMFVYESSVLKFLSLNNAQDQNIESLQFRVYNVLSPNSIIDCSRMSFNIYAIDDTENQGIILI